MSIKRRFFEEGWRYLWCKDKMISFILRCYYVLLVKTCKFEAEGMDELWPAFAKNAGALVTVAHQSLLVSAVFFDGKPFTLLASLSKDGQIIANILESRGFMVIRGSSSRGGPAALAALTKALDDGAVLGITFDGPRGPPCVPKPGTAFLAFETKKPAFFLEIHPRVAVCRGVMSWIKWPGYFRVRSWDRFLLPLPFGRFSLIMHKIAKDGKILESYANEQPVGSGEEKTRTTWCRAFNLVLERKARLAYGALYGGKPEAKNSN